MRVIVQKTARITLIIHTGFWPSAGEISQAADPAIKDRMVGNQTRLPIHCSQMARNPM